MATQDFPPRPAGATPQSPEFIGWVDVLGQNQNIDMKNELTSVASGDEIAIFDVSETGQVKTKKATVSNIGSTVVGGGHAGSFTTVTATGLVDISGASAGQIKFPATQNASSNANTLDDYEEGSFTPTIESTGGGAAVYTTQIGRYTKIGDRVLFSIRVVTTNLGTLAGGNVTIAGLAITSNADTSVFHALSIAANQLAATATTAINAAVLNNSTSISPSRFTAGASVQLTVADLGTTSVFNVAGVYQS